MIKPFALLLVLSLCSLAAAKKPNFLIIILDDVGYDDIGIHHPPNPLIETPSLDAFAAQSTELENFYVHPMCSLTRASLLTGRHTLRSGVWGVDGGIDYMNLTETTVANMFSKAGYETLQVSKWHSGKTDGYIPLDRGFSDMKWSPYVTYWNSTTVDNTRQGAEMPGFHTMTAADEAIDMINAYASFNDPFFAIYAPHSIHRGVNYSAAGATSIQSQSQGYFPPNNYTDYFTQKMNAMYPGQDIYEDLPKIYAELRFQDDQIGRILQTLKDKGLDSNTYVIYTNDNGPALKSRKEATGLSRQIRMPSGMRGEKGVAAEGGVRNTFLIRGPGVAAGAKRREIAGIEDITPTVISLANISAGAHLPWDGKDLTPILVNVKPAVPPPRYLTDRTLISFELYNCGLVYNLLFKLGANRRVIKPQPLLDFKTGSKDGEGYSQCAAVRYKNYKYFNGVLYRFPNASYHREDASTVVRNQPAMKNKLAKVAETWWNKVILREPGSFEKPIATIGWLGAQSSRVFSNLAMQVSNSKLVRIGSGSVAGFSKHSDFLFLRQKVYKTGNYSISMTYAGNGTGSSCSLKLSVGSYASIQAKKAPNLTFKLASSTSGTTKTLGTLRLRKTPSTSVHELKLQLLCRKNVAGVGVGKTVFYGAGLSYLDFTLIGSKKPSFLINPVLDALEVLAE